jgi:hypothetical protein
MKIERHEWNTAAGRNKICEYIEQKSNKELFHLIIDCKGQVIAMKGPFQSIQEGMDFLEENLTYGRQWYYVNIYALPLSQSIKLLGENFSKGQIDPECRDCASLWTDGFCKIRGTEFCPVMRTVKIAEMAKRGEIRRTDV